MTIVYQPRDFNECSEDNWTNDVLAGWIEVNAAKVWFRAYDAPVRLQYFLIGAMGAAARIKDWDGRYSSVILEALEVIDPADDARNNTLLCPVCGGEGLVYQGNSPDGTRCYDCFGSGTFLHPLY